jgi:ABC-type cobalamin/Fe3+-siderophores transport system ATPase subunit
MHPWLGWILWVNPLAYRFEALLANEFRDKAINCAAANLIPSRGAYTDRANQACSGVPGATTGASSLTGLQYLDALKYSPSHIWRNFGILWAWWVLFVATTIIFTTMWKDSSEAGSTMLVPYEKQRHFSRLPDIKSQGPPVSTGSHGDKKPQPKLNLAHNSSVFTWKDLVYLVKTPSGDRVLLNKVYGWVQPGSLTALMGSSGAGKTTLLNVLAQRKTEGTIHGSVQVDRRPLPISFQRSTGYCEQLDVHEPYATVREALIFSALLRQPASTPEEEKLAYVHTVIDLLELHDIADTLIVRVGAGLNIEQRKRVTISIKLVSKPKILLFPDKPTSALDGQAAFNTIHFLQKLANCGQAVLVIVYQPSA